MESSNRVAIQNVTISTDKHPKQNKTEHKEVSTLQPKQNQIENSWTKTEQNQNEEKTKKLKEKLEIIVELACIGPNTC